ncbi:MAG: glycerophosphodiester phosphodiesterase [Candidatus Odinarchaeota archaeon]
MNPYIFAHRGASGYEIENTIISFKKAISMGAGIETDIRATKDKKLICFHDRYFKIDNKYHPVRKFCFEEIKKIKFADERVIPLVQDVFQEFKNNLNNVRFSFDIENREVGVKLLTIAKKYSLLNKIVITDRRLKVLSHLRNINKKVKLIYTLTSNINNIKNEAQVFKKLKELDINIINVKFSRYIEELFKIIIENDFNCYVWGVNTKMGMKKVLKLNTNKKKVAAIYTDYPDKLFNLIMEE